MDMIAGLIQHISSVTFNIRSVLRNHFTHVVLSGLGWEYYWSLFIAAGLFAWQQKLIFKRERDACFKAFMNNNYVGLVLFLGLAMGYMS